MSLNHKRLAGALYCLAGVLILLLSPCVAIGASTHVPTGSWVYPALERLEAQGLVPSGILTSRPINRAEAARLAVMADGRARSEATGRIIRKLKKEFSAEISGTSGTYLRPVEAGVKYLYADGVPYLLNVNNLGDLYGNGSNYRAGFAASAGAGGVLSAYLAPEFRYPEGGSDADAEAVLVEGYASLEIWNLELLAGRQALWWGPGHHGALLVSDNARPFDLIKISNPSPAVLPWIFKYLGPLKFTAFATRLEEDRDFPNPYFAGMRLELKPYPLVNIGLTRTAMFGGEGRHVDAGVVWDVITAQTENFAGEPGNQIGAVDLKIILPFDLQNIVLYGELGGEDEAGSLPSRVAYLAGAYLPGFLGCDALDLRVEYGQTYIGNYPGVWYTHHLYTTGYTYDGRTIGHHMGTDAKDLFLSASYSSYYGDFTVAFDMEASGRTLVKSKNRSAAVSWSKALNDKTELSVAYVNDRRTGMNGIAGNNSDANSLSAGLKYGF